MTPEPCPNCGWKPLSEQPTVEVVYDEAPRSRWQRLMDLFGMDAPLFGGFND